MKFAFRCHRMLARQFCGISSRDLELPAATEILRHGLPLAQIGLILRHRGIDTTAYYAKVDVALLKQIAQPWPEVTNRIDPDKWSPLIMNFQKFYGLSKQKYTSRLRKYRNGRTRHFPKCDANTCYVVSSCLKPIPQAS
nr:MULTISPECIES: hypothetical protein [unclassified Caballeronia]